MAEIDISGPDRQIGSLLSGDEVERLREAINWVRRHRGLRMKEIARDCEAPEHTVRNFAYRKSIRPDGAFLGRLYKYFVNNRELLPEGFFSSEHEPDKPSGEGFLGKVARYDLIKMELPISETDLKRVYDRYSGYYLCFRNSYQPETMSVSWLHILPLRPKTKVPRWGLPLPRFTVFIRYPDMVDPGTLHSYVIIGYAFSRNGRIYLSGQHDGELKYFILNEPTISKFTYIQGINLQTSAEDKQPFATRVVLQHLGQEVARDDWADRIGVFGRDDFKGMFDNADVVLKALGKDVLHGPARR
jgi:hypothetical protein